MYVYNVIYYLYTKILKDEKHRLNKDIVKDAVKIFGFNSVYNSGYIKSFKLYSKVDRKIIEKSNLLSQRSIDFIYTEDPYKNM